jgi:hypothetical protein
VGIVTFGASTLGHRLVGAGKGSWIAHIVMTRQADLLGFLDQHAVLITAVGVVTGHAFPLQAGSMQTASLGLLHQLTVTGNAKDSGRAIQ